MKEIESLMIRYVGYREPRTPDEVELEILGLRTAIAAAGQRIAVLDQSLRLQEIKQMRKDVDLPKAQLEKTEEETDEKTVAKASQAKEVEQQD